MTGDGDGEQRPVFYLNVDGPSPAKVKQRNGVVSLPNHCSLVFVYRCSLCNWQDAQPPTVLFNLPATAAAFERKQFRSFTCVADLTECCWKAEVPVDVAGSFDYFMRLGDGKESDKEQLVVQPDLVLKVNGGERTFLQPEQVCCMTMVTKCMGGLKRWRALADSVARMEYNMIHLTPVQKLGMSRSAYSLFDQLTLTDQLLPSSEKASDEQESDDAIKERELRAFVRDIYEKRGVLCITDVVWNHTACNSEWIREHPEACYNLENSPHLRPAYALDRALQLFSQKAARRHEVIQSRQDVDRIVREIQRELLPELKMWEFYVLDVAMEVHRFRSAVESGKSVERVIEEERAEGIEMKEHGHHPYSSSIDNSCVIIGSQRRGSKRVRLSCALRLFNDSGAAAACELEERCNMYRRALDKYNLPLYQKWDSDQEALLKNLQNTLTYQRIDPKGPQKREVTKEEPLFDPYFTVLHSHPLRCKSHAQSRQTLQRSSSFLERELDGDVEEESPKCVSDSRIDGAEDVVAASAGWVWGAAAADDFAAPGSSVYVRRELIAWSDSVKMRYGDGPEDCPYLWNRMEEYTRFIASVFHGVRIDNCHTTPLHVAQHLLDCARRVNPNLYVVAELFTEDKRKDDLYCSSLGLSALIREAMQCDSPETLARRVAEFSTEEPISAHTLQQGEEEAHFLSPQSPACMFMDCTHDNDAPPEKRAACDYLPNSALVSMANCAIGSTFGYDQLVPHRISVVHEERLYKLDLPIDSLERATPTFKQLPCEGIEVARRSLNLLHRTLITNGFTQVTVSTFNAVVQVIRHNPHTEESVYLFGHTAFEERSRLSRADHPDLPIAGVFEEELIASVLRVSKPSYQRHELLINGMQPTLYWTEPGSKSPCKTLYELNEEKIHFARFPPGSVVAFWTSLDKASAAASKSVRKLCRPALVRDLLAQSTLLDLNVLLYRCNEEERVTVGESAYDVPGYGQLVYCGLQGAASALQEARESGWQHPICRNLTNGLWLVHYLAERIKAVAGLVPLHKWILALAGHLRKVPSYAVPKHVDLLVSVATNAAKKRAVQLMSSYVRQGDEFVQSLALVSVQLFGDVKNAPLRAEKLLELSDAEIKRFSSLQRVSPSLAAGLPHFSQGFMRNWGRDTFISLRGLFLVTGRLEEALDLILAYGECVRHGLVPNLLDGGKNPRYNARDAVWWWLQALQDYCAFAFATGDEEEDLKNTGAFLSTTTVTLHFPLSSSDGGVSPTPSSQSNASASAAVPTSPLAGGEAQSQDADDEKADEEEVLAEEEVLPPKKTVLSLAELVAHILQCHASGIHFREWGAGPGLDQKMQEKGFDVDVWLDESTGFLHGGNRWNCGTWMDKMGESGPAGNWGVPATPRDGAAVELTALLKSTMRWLSGLARRDAFSASPSVSLPSGSTWTYEEWGEKVQESFERHFYVPSSKPSAASEAECAIDWSLVHRTGIYRDTVGASAPHADYQLRPNQCVALAVAPELFETTHAEKAVEIIGTLLAGPLGMRTLDASDWKYHGYYSPDDEGSFDVAKGFSYHQGPEWVWLYGFYLRAMANFPGHASRAELQRRVAWLLRPHRQAIAASKWTGLTELTNRDGALCPASSPTQAWSAATLLDALHFLS